MTFPEEESKKRPKHQLDQARSTLASQWIYCSYSQENVWGVTHRSRAASKAAASLKIPGQGEWWLNILQPWACCVTLKQLSRTECPPGNSTGWVWALCPRLLPPLFPKAVRDLIASLTFGRDLVHLVNFRTSWTCEFFTSGTSCLLPGGNASFRSYKLVSGDQGRGMTFKYQLRNRDRTYSRPARTTPKYRMTTENSQGWQN